MFKMAVSALALFAVKQSLVPVTGDVHFKSGALYVRVGSTSAGFGISVECLL
jgi:hypothetical protein